MIQSLDARQDLGYKEGKGIVLIVLIQKIERLMARKSQRKVL
jgi:ribosomal protein L15E